MNHPSRQNVWQMFDKISKTYDRVNRIVSLGFDQKWRRKTAEFLPQRENLNILDLATGTGDQALALLKSKASIEKIIGIDLSSQMLAIAKKKKIEKLELLKADAEKLPFANDSFDAATFSFGIRNVSNPLTALQEIHRVLKPKGRCLILEFSMPPQPIRTFYLFYLRQILPFLGGVFSKNFKAYRYLNQTIESFPSGKNFCQWMTQAEFAAVDQFLMNLGTVSLYIGEKV